MPDARPIIRLSEPARAGTEADLVREVLDGAIWHGDGPMTQRATYWLRERLGAPGALMTSSCTHALDMAARLIGLGPGDEAIVPSFTFPSTATAVALTGATPVFVDVLEDTLNLDPDAVAAALTDRTRAVFVVHYGGVAARVEELRALLQPRGIALVEDNAHGLGASWQGTPLGRFGRFATQSWHDTKNITSGEGGALVINDLADLEPAEILREKGTNRSRFLRGQVDKYTWVDHGSSYLPSELGMAVLVAQMAAFDQIQAVRHRVWDAYAAALGPWAASVGARLLRVPEGARHPAHLFAVIMPSAQDQPGLIGHLAQRGVVGAFHYQPLDSSPAGQRLGRTPEPCAITAQAAQSLVRLPLHSGMSLGDTERVIDAVTAYEVR